MANIIVYPYWTMYKNPYNEDIEYTKYNIILNSNVNIENRENSIKSKHQNVKKFTINDDAKYLIKNTIHNKYDLSMNGSSIININSTPLYMQQTFPIVYPLQINPPELRPMPIHQRQRIQTRLPQNTQSNIHEESKNITHNSQIINQHGKKNNYIENFDDKDIDQIRRTEKLMLLYRQQPMFNIVNKHNKLLVPNDPPNFNEKHIVTLTPIKHKNIKNSNGLYIKRGIHGVCQKQQRGHEDRYQIKQIGPFRYYAIFDGHGGTKQMGPNHVGDYAVNHLHERLEENFQNINLNNVLDVINAIDNTFIKLDIEMYDNNLSHGSTCTIILIDDYRNIIYQINLGDSRSIIFLPNKIISVTEDHSATDKNEIARITSAGGKVFYGRVQGQLMVSRSFGDFPFKINKNKPYDPINGMVSAKPDIKIISLNDLNIDITKTPLHIILTSDAPYERDAFDDYDLINLFWKKLKINSADNNNIGTIVANAMVEHIAPKTTDDTTIMIVSY